MRRSILICSLSCALLLCLSTAGRAQNQGFQINRYEPTTAGEWSFWVDHPWYSATRYFAAGLTLNYGHNPLVFGRVTPGGGFEQQEAVLSHQLLMHLDVAGSLFNRVTASFSLPVILYETGQEFGGIRPLYSGGIADPRIGVMGRLWGEPDASKISVNLGFQIWLPLRKFSDSLPAQTSDQEVRALPKIVLAGLPLPFLRYSASLGFLIRPDAVIGDLSQLGGRSVGSEVQIGASAYYVNTRYNFSAGPELLLSTIMTGGNGFKRDYTALEILFGGHYHLFKRVMLGTAFGLGALREPGTPDFRWLLRAAWAPLRGPRKARPAEPIEPSKDRDRDGVADSADACPDIPQGPQPDPARPGCPLNDRDKDGVPDAEDQCPDIPMGERTDPLRLGCPIGDRDKDGVPDPDDRCPDVPAGMHPDPDQPGCPLPDRDKDSVIDAKDACPDKPGAPHPDPKKNGCPGLVEVRQGQLRILKPVFFATDKDTILKESFPVLQAVADALLAQPQIRRVGIEGHTDDRGALDYNTQLSDRRARSVLKWLVQKGIQPDRLEARGFGPTRPIKGNDTAAGRAANRRVEFHILDPAQEGAEQQLAPSELQSPDPTDGPGGKRKK